VFGHGPHPRDASTVGGDGFEPPLSLRCGGLVRTTVSGLCAVWRVFLHRVKSRGVDFSGEGEGR
jgi:hypothetical protein